MEPVIGKIYTWKEVQTNWYGEETFLSKRDGKIVCGTLDRKKNPHAPDVMIVGVKVRNMQRAQEFCDQNTPIPIFLKESPNRWSYAGKFEIDQVITDKTDLIKAEKTYGRQLTRLIFLRPYTKEQPYQPVIPDIDLINTEVKEGHKQLMIHIRRERNRQIIKLKKQLVLSESKTLACEVCDFDFSVKYKGIVESFCEVHHRTPLGKTEDSRITRLDDLAILCSNCHRVIHLVNPMPSVDDLRNIIK